MKHYLRINKIILNAWGASDQTQVLTFFGNLMALTGPNGVGKTTFLDAVIAILLGTFDKKNFNVAQKREGDKSKRNALGYLRGERRYAPPLREGKNFVSCIAIEWLDEETAKTYCSGILTEVSASEERATPPFRLFTLNGPAPFNNFRNMTLADLKALVESRKREYENEFGVQASKIHETKESYISYLYDRIMGGVDPARFSSLIMSAIKMRLDAPIEEFIKTYLFRSEVQSMEVIQHFSERAAALEKAKKDCLAYKARIDELAAIVAAGTEYGLARTDSDLLEEAKDKIKVDLLEKLLRKTESLISGLKGETANSEFKLSELKATIEKLQKEQFELLASMEKTDWKQKQKEQDNLQELIRSKSRELDRWNEIADALREWEKCTLFMESIMKPFRQNIDKILSGKFSESDFNALRNQINGAKKQAEQKYDAVSNKLLDKYKALEEAKAELVGFKNDIPLYASVSSETLKNAIAFLGRELKVQTGVSVPVEILSRTFEIVDTKWKNAIEGRFTHKASLIVPPEYTDMAQKILKNSTFSEDVALIDSRKMVDDIARVKENSLYEAVSCDKDYIDAALRYYLGGIIKCETIEELRHAGNGVTPDCVSYGSRQFAVIKKIYYTKYASIGKSIPQSVIDDKEAEIRDIASQISELNKEKASLRVISRYEDLSRHSFEQIKDYSTLGKQVDDLYDKLNELIEEIEQLRNGEIKELEAKCEAKAEQLDLCKKEQDDLYKKIAELGNRESLNVERLNGINRSLNAITEKRGEFSEGAADKALTWVNNHPTVTNPETVDSLLSDEIASKKALCDTLGSKFLSMQYAFSSKYPNSSVNNSLDCLDAMRAELEHMMSEYDENWEPQMEKLLTQSRINVRDNLLNMLNAQIRSASTSFNEINRALRKMPFGGSIYQITMVPESGELKEIYDMLSSPLLIHLSSSDLDATEQQLSFEEKEFFDEHQETVDKFLSLFEMPEREEHSKEDYDALMEVYRKRVSKYADYRTYFKFGMRSVKAMDENGTSISAKKTAETGSGGESEIIKYVVLLSSFAILYKQEKNRNVKPGIILLDEAFDKLDMQHCKDILEFARQNGLQILMCAPDRSTAPIIKELDTIVCLSRDDKENVCMGCFDRRKARKEDAA